MRVPSDNSGIGTAIRKLCTCQVTRRVVAFVSFGTTSTVRRNVVLRGAIRTIVHSPFIATDTIAVGNQTCNVPGMGATVEAIGTDSVAVWVIIVAIRAHTAVERFVEIVVAGFALVAVPRIPARTVATLVRVPRHVVGVACTVGFRRARQVALGVCVIARDTRTAILGDVVVPVTERAVARAPLISAITHTFGKQPTHGYRVAGTVNFVGADSRALGIPAISINTGPAVLRSVNGGRALVARVTKPLVATCAVASDGCVPTD